MLFSRVRQTTESRSPLLKAEYELELRSPLEIPGTRAKWCLCENLLMREYISRFEKWLVAIQFSQNEGVDSYENFASVIPVYLFLLLLKMFIQQMCYIHRANISMAFFISYMDGNRKAD